MAVTSKRPNDLPGSGIDPFDSRAARVAALDALARRDHATGDLRRKLLFKGFDPTIVGEVIERLREEKLLDDRRYVANFIGYRAARGQGPLRVRADLRKLGLPDDVVEDGVGGYADWVAHLRRARQKKFGAELPTDYAERQRQARFLAYRGFTGAQIRSALGIDIEMDSDT